MDGALGAVLAESGGGLLMQRGAKKHRGDRLAIFAAIRRAIVKLLALSPYLRLTSD
jgi:hypothetical protein